MKFPKKLIVPTILMSIILTGCGMKIQQTDTSNQSQKITISDEMKSGAQTEVDQEIESHIDEASKMLKKHGEVSKKVWPEYDLSQNNIIACQIDDTTNEVINAWKLTNKEKVKLTAEQIKDLNIPSSGTFNGVKFEGKKSIVIGISKDKLPDLNKIANFNIVYEMGVHEMFHLYYESFKPLMKIAKQSNELGGRGTEFPKQAEPRVYRKMIYDNLVLAFENPKDEDIYLGKAKYWNEKWKTEYQKESYQTKLYDILEGKARYIQNMMSISYNGISDIEETNKIINIFDKNTNPSDSTDSESYKLGFVAGVLLDKKDSNWKEEITKNPETPVELLLKDVKIINDDTKDYEEKLKTSKEQLKEVNKDIDLKLENIKQAEKNTAIPFLQLSQKSLKGSFETSGFIQYMGSTINTDFGGTFENKNGDIVLKNLSVYSTDGRKSSYILPIDMDYKISDGRLIIDNEFVKGDIKVKQTKDKYGRTIYIMK